MRKKVIAVCAATIQDHFRTEFLSYLHKYAAEKNFKVIVFTSNSAYEINHTKTLEESTLFSFINYDKIDAGIIIAECFHNQIIPAQLVEKFREKNLPVMIVHGNNDGYHTIVREYEVEYKKLISHVIEAHNCRDLFFLGGYNQSDVDPETPERLAYFKQVLLEHNIPFNEENVAYANYDKVLASKVIGKVISAREKLPDAIICANDNMALGVCDLLNQNNIRVPDDVIVTGFDGVQKARFNSPRISTCREDTEGLAKTCVDNILAEYNGEYEKLKFTVGYKLVLSESCGCDDHITTDFRKHSQLLFDTTLDNEDFEKKAFAWADAMMSSTEITEDNETKGRLEDVIFENSFMSLRDDFISFSIGTLEESKRHVLTDRMMIYSTGIKAYKYNEINEYDTCNMVPDWDDWLEDNTTMYVVSDISMDGEFIGLYSAKIRDITSQVIKTVCISKVISLVMNATVNKMRKTHFKESVQNSRYIDSFTGLPNYMGVNRWFNNFAKTNTDKLMSVSVYDLPDYKFIQDNFGIEEINRTLNSVAEALKIANAKNGFIGKISDSQFVVLNWVSTSGNLGPIISEAVRVFFNCLSGINSSNEKGYFIEVNCGCTVVNPGWTPNLNSFVKFATAELYKNRIHSFNTLEQKKDAGQDENAESRLSALVEKNMFHYHFQPIFDMRNQSIYAYEALMRTPSEIGMSPEQVLSYARKNNRTYDIEKATMFNVMEEYLSRKSEFDGIKVFINSIPGFFLTSEDQKNFEKRYNGIMDAMVVEITEQDSLSDEELKRIKKIGGKGLDVPVALDDYGTGHSNIVNLMRYKPQYVKIDRYLINDIHKNTNKQMFVKNTIEFAHMNDMLVLAEGVETREEMETVVRLGVDLVQGFYTGRPSPQLKKSLNKEIIEGILQARAHGSL